MESGTPSNDDTLAHRHLSSCAPASPASTAPSCLPAHLIYFSFNQRHSLPSRVWSSFVLTFTARIKTDFHPPCDSSTHLSAEHSTHANTSLCLSLSAPPTSLLLLFLPIQPRASALLPSTQGLHGFDSYFSISRCRDDLTTALVQRLQI